MEFLRPETSSQHLTVIPASHRLPSIPPSSLRRQGSRSCTSSTHSTTAIFTKTVVLQFEVILLNPRFRICSSNFFSSSSRTPGSRWLKTLVLLDPCFRRDDVGARKWRRNAGMMSGHGDDVRTWGWRRGAEWEFTNEVQHSKLRNGGFVDDCLHIRNGWSD